MYSFRTDINQYSEAVCWKSEYFRLPPDGSFMFVEGGTFYCVKTIYHHTDKEKDENTGIEFPPQARKGGRWCVHFFC